MCCTSYILRILICYVLIFIFVIFSSFIFWLLWLVAYLKVSFPLCSGSISTLFCFFFFLFLSLLKGVFSCFSACLHIFIGCQTLTFIIVGCWLLLYIFQHSWDLFWDLVKLLSNWSLKDLLLLFVRLDQKSF